MSDFPNQPQNPDSPFPTPSPRRKRRRWPKVLLALAVLLVLLVVLLPTIASTGPVRSFVVGKINEQIHGRVQIDGWSLGWFSPTHVTGIKVYDQDQRLILDVPRVQLGLSLLDAARQNFAMGDDNVIEVASFLVTVDKNQNTSIDRLTRKSSAPRPAEEGPTEVPDVSGTFTINIQQGTIESEEKQWPALHVRKSQATAAIADINQPIQSTLDLVYQIGQSPESTIHADGSIAAVKGNVLNVAQFSAAQKVKLTDVNLAAAEPFVDAVPNLGGLVNGEIDIKAEGLAGLSTTGQLKVAEFRAGAYHTPVVTIPIQITRSALPGGDSLIKFDNVGIQTSEGTLALTGQVPESAIRNVINGKAPGAQGSISLVAAVTDLKELANQFKDTLQLQEGVSVSDGTAREELSVTITQNQLQIVQNLRFQAKGKRGGQDIEIKPITVAASAVAIPAGQAMPDFRNIKLNVNSTFATITGGGDSLAKLAIAGKVALNTLSSELSQFVDMQGVQLQGGGDFALNTDGELVDDNSPILVKATGTFQNVKIVGLLDQPVDQDRLSFETSGIVNRKNQTPTDIDKGYFVVVGGEPNAPLLDVQGNYTVDLVKNSIPWFELIRCTVTSLPKLQQQYGGLVPELARQGIVIESGAFYATAAGSYVDEVLTLSKPAGISITTLTLKKGNQTILNREVLRAGAHGKLSLKNGVAGEFTDLSVTTQSNLVILSKGGQGPLTFTMTETNGQTMLRGNGVVTLAADLKRVNDLAQSFGGQVTVSRDQPQVRSGAITGTLTLAKTDRPQTDLTFNGQITGLTIANAAGPIAQNEQLTITLTAAAPDDLKANPISANAKLTGSFINATVSEAQLATGGATMDILRSANVQAQVTDLAKAHALFIAAEGGAAPTTGPAVPPLQVTGGSANLRVNITRDIASKTTNVAVTDATIARLSLKRGAQSYAFDPNAPITFKLAAAATGSESPDSIDITELSGDVRIASLSMPERIRITGLNSSNPAYTGAIAARGKLEDVTPLLAVLQGGDKLPYGGDFAAAQKVAMPSDSAASLTGSFDVNGFKVFDTTGRNVVFSEPQLAVKNTISLDLAGKKVQVDTLTLNMPQSQALGLSFTGGVNGWDTTRQIRPNTKLDVTYDLEKVWTIIRPMLSPEQQATYKDLKIAGKYQRSFALTGAFPEGPIERSFASLNADGSLAIDLLDTMGLNIQKLQPQIKMTRGKVLITGAPAVLNEGTLDVSEIVIDMTRPAPELTVARNKRLVRNAKINPVLANSLGKFASVLFSDARQASGLLDVTVVECQQVPVTALMTQSNAARAKIVYSIRDIQVDGVVPKAMSEFLALGTPGLVGEVPESTVTLADGQVASDLTFAIRRTGTDGRGQEVISQLPLKFVGGVGMKDLVLRNFEVLIPKELVPNRIFGTDIGDFRRVLPPQIRVPITGTLDKIQFDPAKAVLANINPLQRGGENQDPLQNLGDLLNQLGNQRNQDRPPPPQDPPRPRGRGQ